MTKKLKRKQIKTAEDFIVFLKHERKKRLSPQWVNGLKKKLKDENEK